MSKSALRRFAEPQAANNFDSWCRTASRLVPTSKGASSNLYLLDRSPWVSHLLIYLINALRGGISQSQPQQKTMTDRTKFVSWCGPPAEKLVISCSPVNRSVRTRDVFVFWLGTSTLFHRLCAGRYFSLGAWKGPSGCFSIGSRYPSPCTAALSCLASVIACQGGCRQWSPLNIYTIRCPIFLNR